MRTKTHVMNTATTMMALMTIFCCLMVWRTIGTPAQGSLRFVNYLPLVIAGVVFAGWLIYAIATVATGRVRTPLNPMTLRWLVYIGYVTLFLILILLWAGISSVWALPVAAILWIAALIITIRNR